MLMVKEKEFLSDRLLDSTCAYQLATLGSEILSCKVYSCTNLEDHNKVSPVGAQNTFSPNIKFLWLKVPQIGHSNWF